MKTWPETTCTFTDLPGTGGGSGANVTVTISRGSVFTSQNPLPSRSTKAVSVSVPTFAPSQLMSAVPSAPVVTAPRARVDARDRVADGAARVRAAVVGARCDLHARRLAGSLRRGRDGEIEAARAAEVPRHHNGRRLAGPQHPDVPLRADACAVVGGGREDRVVEPGHGGIRVAHHVVDRAGGRLLEVRPRADLDEAVGAAAVATEGLGADPARRARHDEARREVARSRQDGRRLVEAHGHARRLQRPDRVGHGHVVRAVDVLHALADLEHRSGRERRREPPRIARTAVAGEHRCGGRGEGRAPTAPDRELTAGGQLDRRGEATIGRGERPGVELAARGAVERGLQAADIVGVDIQRGAVDHAIHGVGRRGAERTERQARGHDGRPSTGVPSRVRPGRPHASKLPRDVRPAQRNAQRQRRLLLLAARWARAR